MEQPINITDTKITARERATVYISGIQNLFDHWLGWGGWHTECTPKFVLSSGKRWSISFAYDPLWVVDAGGAPFGFQGCGFFFNA